MRIPPFDEFLGTRIVSHESGTAEVCLDLEARHLNRRGVAHGGVVSALLDSALGAAVVSAIPVEWWCATTSLSTQFLDGAGPGRLTAVGRVIKRGRKVAFASGELRDARGRLLATASGTWHLWDRRPGRRPATPAAGEAALRDGTPFRVGKILAVGRNYADHVREMGAPPAAPPVLFLKPSSALVQHGAVIHLPQGAGAVHHEVELVVAVGRRGRAFAVEQALDHVLGYGVGLDLTLRDLQNEAKQRGEPWSLAKGFDGSAPVSRFAPREELGDASGLELSLQVNGEWRQRGNTSEMLCGVAELLAFASRWLTLEPGDLLFTGTPAGVGPLCPGDRLLARLGQAAELEISVAADPPRSPA